MKFGGSSVASATNISKVLDIVLGGDRTILVCSAIKGCTDALLKAAELHRAGDGEWKSVISDLEERHSGIIRRLFTGAERRAADARIKDVFAQIRKMPDTLESFGEILSTLIISDKLQCEGIKAVWLDSRGLIKVGSDGRVLADETYSGIREAVASHPEAEVFVAPGFIASDGEGRVVTLGRGGSDYSAALYAAAVKADSLQIWTDVPGIMTANPKVVPSAVTVPTLSYSAAFALAEHGAKVLYAPTVIPARDAGIPFSILNTFDPSAHGTVVCNLEPGNVTAWRGVTSRRAEDAVELCLVGEGPAVGAKVTERIAAVLKENGIRVLGSSSEDEGRIQLCTVLQGEEKAALAALHREFFEEPEINEIKVFLAGYGAVGKEFHALLERSGAAIAGRTLKSIRIVGISDSRHYTIDMSGADPKALSCDASDGAFFREVARIAPRGSILVDCTGSETTGQWYQTLFEHGVGVVSSNRRALSGQYSLYAAMKAAARENGVPFCYETTVGTALPVLESISSGANSCDKVVSIEALVSCTLNNIFSSRELSPHIPMCTLVRKAQEAGLTEKDPRQDLGGRDALRKLLILGREAGIPLEEEDVDVRPVLGEEFFDCSLDEFYRRLEAAEPSIAAEEEALGGKRRRFIASIVEDASSPTGYRASIGVRPVVEGDPFYWVCGTENIIKIKSEYMGAPLVIRGAGEGARQAAAGILNDILK